MKTKLFHILSKVSVRSHCNLKSQTNCNSQKMPKGALLHAHLDAMVNASFLLKLGLEQPAMHIRVPEALNSSSIKSILPEFKGLPQSHFNHASSITDIDYKPGTWVQIKRARETFELQLGGPEGFDAWVIGALMINPSEAYKTHNSVKKA